MKRLLFILILIAINAGVSAQSLSDIQNVKVDNLSDAQIEQLIKRAEGQGLNEQQMLNMAAERGMPAGEVAKLRQRINALRSGGGSMQQQQQGTARQGQLRQVQGMRTQEDIFDSLRKSDPYYDLSPTQKKIFGYKLFHNRNLNFNPSLNVPTPQGYTVGGGDQLLIDVYGASQQSYDVTVNPDGRIFIPNVGPIQVGGSTIAAASSRIRTALTRIYSGLGGSNPNTFMDIRLGNIRTVSISLVGELVRPGTYTLPSFASPFNALFSAGGPNENGSFRHIQIYRDSKLLKEIDIYEFLVKGEFTTPITLRDNDVIIVPPVRSRVEIIGPVRREGLFEMKAGETLENLIAFAGGFSSQAYRERITVTRKTGEEMRVEDVDAANFGAFFSQDGDTYRVGEILNRFENRVQITGALMRPGTFALNPGMGVRDLVDRAQGLREDAFVNRATLYRTRGDFSLEILPVDIKAILNGEVEDIALRREDVLNIPSIYDLREEFYVKISGEVNRPGAFAFGENMTVADLVLKAGGFKESATSSKVEIARRVKDDISGKLAEIILLDVDRDLKVSGTRALEPLQPFDHVMIRRSPGFQREQLVRVDGEAFFPGEYAIAHADERISDLIKRAGGLNNYAYPKGATLIRRNEFYKEPSEDEIKAETLTKVKANISRDSLDRTESDKILSSRIDRKIAETKSADKARRGTIDAEDFRQQSIMELGESQEGIGQIQIKDTELIGIDLETILKNPYGPEDLILREGDVLSIPRELQTVRMRGEVLYPTSARYRENAGFKQYISRAGGFTEKSRRGRSYVIYANGDVQRTRKFLFINAYPSIEPGAEIIVPAKPEREPMSIQGWVGLATSLTTLVILIDRIGSN
ncbi:SLBB domain-containing protein [Cecembia lonarensis]|uniref:Polysialic acid transport protein kpsD n=1 Tax=Cecembia lonarensis (strain CCUG 58316 / KCTC 22772 / LW9) TaxID=1225176 RepID=K1LDA7_CECL9|nr:SLBB domain-containing protein [Cecembia lonarensis]EKB48323.1 Polysialic acid transport protein kpsD precursor [Cecembia lonarensis LW9]